MSSLLSTLPTLILLGLIAALLWWSRRRAEIFRVEITQGQPKVVHGRVPPSYLGDVRAIVRGLDGGIIRAVRDGGEGRIVTTGIDEARAQRLRNAFSVHSVSKL